MAQSVARRNLIVQSRISVIDTHTGGEPTRVVISGGPELGSGTMAERLAVFRDRFDTFRSAVVNEPRGSDVMVGAILLPPADPDCAAEVIFFNNVGYLGMCGHGTIGVAVALAHLGRIGPGSHRLGTPVGTVTITLEGRNTVAIDNVESYRLAKNVKVTVPGLKTYLGDVAWGGNWFFLARLPGVTLELAHVSDLRDKAIRIRGALQARGVAGDESGAVDNVQFFGPPRREDADSRNFVLSPGDSFDRSPCGTGTAARMATLYARGLLRPGQQWRQESITGSLFTGWLTRDHELLIPHIRGHAFVTGQGTLFFNPADTLRGGLRAD
jgi:4-hydroxyproline epimerase